jgi:hypothetical protein
MVVDKELEGYAQECTRLAGMTDDPAIREPLLKMARDWMEVARAEQQSASSLADEHRREPNTHRARH